MKKFLIPLLFLYSCKSVEKISKPEVCTMGVDSTEFHLNAEAHAREKKPNRNDTVVINPTNPDRWPVLYVDFNGGFVTGTRWNMGDTIFYLPASLDSTGRRLVIENLEEDFRYWYLRITTSEAVYLAAPVNKRQKLILTASTPFGASAGQAFVGSFGSGDPAWVFTTMNYTIKKNKEAASHETGHTFGCYHQDTCGNYYAMGFIMGNGYYVPYPTWHKSSCQDDIQIISKKLQRR